VCRDGGCSWYERASCVETEAALVDVTSLGTQGRRPVVKEICTCIGGLVVSTGGQVVFFPGLVLFLLGQRFFAYK